MLLSPPPARLAGGVILLFLLLLPTALGQDPLPTRPEQGVVGFVISAEDAFLAVDYLGRATTMLVIQDTTSDSGALPGVTGGSDMLTHTTRLEIAAFRPEDAETRGWQVLLGDTSVPTAGGQTRRVPVTIQTTPSMNAREMEVDINATFRHPNGYTESKIVTLHARVNPYSLAYASTVNPSRRAGQFETVVFEIQVTNNGVYPDTFGFTAGTDKPQLRLAVPPSLYVPPGETRSTYLTVLTPHGKLYEFGLSSVINVRATSLSPDGGGGIYPTTALLQVRGAYVPEYWFPLLLVGLVSATVLVRESLTRGDLRRHEKGRPRPVRLTPRQQVALAALRARDPEAYAERKARLRAVFDARRLEYRASRKTRVAADRAERRVARREMSEEKARRKEARQETERALSEEQARQKAQAKIDRKREAAQAKVDRKREKVEAKENAKKERAYRKQLAKLEKRKAKLTAQRAKEDAKAAKQQAKIDAAEAKARAKAEKAAAKAEKAAARAQEKAGNGKP